LLKANAYLLAFVQWAREKLKELEGWWNTHFENIKDYAVTFWGSLKGLAASWLTGVSAIVHTVASLFFGSSDDFRAAWAKMFSDMSSKLWQWIDEIKKAGPYLLSAFQTAFNEMFNWVEGKFNSIYGAIFGSAPFSDAPGGGSGDRFIALSKADTSADAELIRKIAREEGVDPDVAVTVAKSEGLGRSWAGGDRRILGGPCRALRRGDRAMSCLRRASRASVATSVCKEARMG
jgi:hypothetical protein